MQNMKMVVLLGVVILSFCSVALASTKQLPARSEKLEKAKVLSPMMEANQKDFILLKNRLGLNDEQLSRTDVLELVVLAYAKLFDGLETRVVNLENSTRTLQLETCTLRADTDKLQKQFKDLDQDITKLYDWSQKIDDELHNDVAVSGINYEVRKLRQEVASDLDNHSGAINKNAQSLHRLSDAVNQNSIAIGDLINAIRAAH